jgi:hypothetical protein
MPSISTAVRAVCETITIRFSVSRDRRMRRAIDPKSVPRVGFLPERYVP